MMNSLLEGKGDNVEGGREMKKKQKRERERRKRERERERRGERLQCRVNVIVIHLQCSILKHTTYLLRALLGSLCLIRFIKLY